MVQELIEKLCYIGRPAEDFVCPVIDWDKEVSRLETTMNNASCIEEFDLAWIDLQIYYNLKSLILKY